MRDEGIYGGDDGELRENPEGTVGKDEEDERNGALRRVNELEEGDRSRADTPLGGDKDGE